jgi:hypothetical protein
MKPRHSERSEESHHHSDARRNRKKDPQLRTMNQEQGTIFSDLQNRQNNLLGNRPRTYWR